MTDIVGDHILEDANVQLIGAKIGRPTKLKGGGDIKVAKGDSSEEDTGLKDMLAKYKKRIQELESYSSEIQKELTQAQETLIGEMEAKNKCVKQLNTAVTEREDLRHNNAQLVLKVASLEKTVDLLQRKLRQCEDLLNADSKKDKQRKGKDSELTKVLELGSAVEEPVAKVPGRIPSSRGRREAKETAKKVSTVQISFPKK